MVFHKILTIHEISPCKVSKYKNVNYHQVARVGIVWNQCSTISPHVHDMGPRAFCTWKYSILQTTEEHEANAFTVASMRVF